VLLNALVAFRWLSSSQVAWVYPVYCMSFIINAMWYQEIADHAYVLLSKRRATQAFSFQRSAFAASKAARSSSEYESRHIMYRWIRSVSEEIYRTPITLIFVIQTLVVSFVPYVGAPASFVLLCWLYALYCFEYKWMIEQWDWQKRRAYFERRWPYFLGFGTCSSLDCCSALPLPVSERSL